MRINVQYLSFGGKYRHQSLSLPLPLSRINAIKSQQNTQK
jgi:hypothetical protein